MTWISKYWDIINQIYWWPRYIGMQSIPQKKWQKKDGFVCVPQELVNKSGPLYTREKNISDLENYLNGCEEILNHVFDLTFSIASDSVIDETFLKPFGFSDSGPFLSVGRETSSRYGLNGNVTQHDGLYVSKSTAVGVELKLKSSSWPEQIAKYIALLSWEELHEGAREQLGLLFIVPSSSISNHWGKCGLEGPYIERSFLNRKWKKRLPKEISNLFDEKHEHVSSVLDRLKLSVISWNDLRFNLIKIIDRLDLTHRGDQTLYKLLKGFIYQLENHRDTGLTYLN